MAHDQDRLRRSAVERRRFRSGEGTPAQRLGVIALWRFFGNELLSWLTHAPTLRTAHVLYSSADSRLAHGFDRATHVLLRYLQHLLRCASSFQALGCGTQPCR